MVGKRKTVPLTAIVPSDAGAVLAAYVPDLADWPTTWQIEPADIAVGQRIIDLLTPFLTDLLTQSVADKTRRRHPDHLWMRLVAKSSVVVMKTPTWRAFPSKLCYCK